MTLPPRANLVAVRHEDPAIVAAVERAMRAHPELRDDVWKPGPGWIAASSPLPESAPEPEEVRAAGLAFADGRDVVLAAATPERVAATPAERLAELPGDFTFVRFEGDGATAVRACGAGAPIHAGVDGERIAIATRLDLLIAVLDEPWRLEPLTTATWLAGRTLMPYARSLLAGLTLVPRGRAAVLEPRRAVRLVRYWDPQPARGERLKPSPNHARELRDTLLAALERELDAAGRNLLTLSGGVDSSSLAALSAGTLDRPISTVTLTAGKGETRDEELRYIDHLDQRFGFQHRYEWRLAADERFPLLRQAPLAVLPIMHPALCALPAIAAETDVRVLFGGEAADNYCGAELGFTDWAEHTGPLALLRGWREIPGGPRGAARWARHRAGAAIGRPRVPLIEALPRFIHPDVRAAYQEWWHEQRAAAVRERRPRRYLAMFEQHDGYIAMNWEAATTLGIRRAFPFMTRDLIEQAFRWHPSELFGGANPSRTKRILRTALRDDVPAFNLERPDRGHLPMGGGAPSYEWHQDLDRRLVGIVRDDWFPRPRDGLSFMETHALTLISQPLQVLAATRPG